MDGARAKNVIPEVASVGGSPADADLRSPHPVGALAQWALSPIFLLALRGHRMMRDLLRREADGSFLSTKHEGAGIGTESVAAIARRLGGVARFEHDDDAFHASVMLPPQ